MVRDSDYKKALIDSCHHKQECSDRNACDVELLTVGGFSPLEGFLNKDAYEHVVNNMRYVNSALYPACQVDVLSGLCATCLTQWLVICPCAMQLYSSKGNQTLHLLLAVSCRLPGSNLLLGLPVVLDTNNDAVREGQRVRILHTVVMEQGRLHSTDQPCFVCNLVDVFNFLLQPL